MFVAGIQCCKRLYFKVRKPGLSGVPTKAQKALFEQSEEVRLLARYAFPGGVAIREGYADSDQAIAETLKLIDDRAIPAIFDAVFRYDNVLVRVDIVQRLGRNRWRMVDVTASTSVKRHHIQCAAVQQYVMTRNGLRSTAQLMHLNRDYVYEGGPSYRGSLFLIEKLDDEIEEMGGDLQTILADFREALAAPDPPRVEPGKQCKDPFLCEFYDHCNCGLPIDHIGFLPGISRPEVEKLRTAGVTSILNIPQSFPLTERQERVQQCVRAGRPWISGDLGEELQNLVYPLYFMDFETYAPALPLMAGMRPYDHVPFQWSLHAQNSVSAEPTHEYFLAEQRSDPRPAFLDSLCRTLRRRGNIVVWYQQFESSRLSDLAVWFPHYADRIERIQARLVDLWALVRNHVYHPLFRGSFSLKSVAAALLPGISYEGMEITEGTEAGPVWYRMIQADVSDPEKENLRRELLAYCRMDTLVLVRLLEFLREENSGMQGEN
jgi:predicted RecB family nuclease